MILKLFASALVILSASASASSEPDKLPSTLCSSGNPRDTVRMRIIPVGLHYRVSPTPRQIIELGADNHLIRAVFDEMFRSTLCDSSLPEVAGTGNDFEQRIVIYVEGEEDRELLSLEYPSWEDHPKPVRARIGSKTVLIPAAKVRFLLDVSRQQSRTQPSA